MLLDMVTWRRWALKQSWERWRHHTHSISHPIPDGLKCLRLFSIFSSKHFVLKISWGINMSDPHLQRVGALLYKYVDGPHHTNNLPSSHPPMSLRDYFQKHCRYLMNLTFWLVSSEENSHLIQCHLLVCCCHNKFLRPFFSSEKRTVRASVDLISWEA